MKYLHLDSSFQPFQNSIAFEMFTFNGGEPHIRILEDLAAVNALTVTTRIKSFEDFGFLLLANDALQNMGISEIHLILPYFPGARQDRVAVKGEALTVKVFSQMVNTCGFASVTILDPHSDVTCALLERVRVMTNESFVKSCLKGLEDYYLVSPDVGAVKKIVHLSKSLPCKDIIICNKKRDLKTGKLSGFEVFKDDLRGKCCVLVDDICDGGGTFIGLAKELKRKGAGDLILIVTHGIFSRGSSELREYFSKIYCTDAFSNIELEGITQMRLEDEVLGGGV